MSDKYYIISGRGNGKTMMMQRLLEERRKIMTLEEMKIIYLNQREKYKELLPKYREIYKVYYPDEYLKLKEMTENGKLPQFTYEERHISSKVEYLLLDKEDWINLPANFYDPINLRCCDSDFVNKFNYYNWDSCGDRELPHFNIDKKTAEFLGKFDRLVRFLHGFEWVINDCKMYHESFGKPYATDVDFSGFIDSRTVHYEHEDIIITDPCYVIRNDSDDDWSKCDYGSDMVQLGSFTNDKYVTADTLYGDWGCTTYNTDTKEKIGSFCADAGLVSVFSLAQVKAYNPKYDDIENNPWCVTLIKDFTGDVTLKVKFDEEYSEFVRYVEGVGSVNFIGTQTEL